MKPLTPKPSNSGITWVKDLVTEIQREWNKPLVQVTFCHSDAELILQIPVSKVGTKDDIVWHYTKHGKYTVQSGYFLVKERHKSDSEKEKGSSSTGHLKDLTVWRTT